MLLVHKIELKPNRKQVTYFTKSAGVSRFAYNWALAKWKEKYSSGEKTSEASLRKELNSIKRKEFPWMLEVTKVAPQQAIKNLGTAFNRFFKKQGKYPRFKKKGIRDSFRADNGPESAGLDAVPVEGKRIKLPRIGWIRMKESLRFKGQVKSVVISCRAGRWFAAVSVETTKPVHERKNHGSVGVDLGVATLATLSTGEKITGPKAHTELLSRLRRLSRSLSRKKKGSSNFGKAKRKLARLHARVTNIRIDALHKLTTALVLNYNIIGIENLNVSGMVRNRRLARHIMDQSFYEIRRQLEYKGGLYDSVVVVADKFFPSSKLCSGCGERNEKLLLSERLWSCPSCNIKHDRDINAAVNLELLAVSSTAAACGAESAGILV